MGIEQGKPVVDFSLVPHRDRTDLGLPRTSRFIYSFDEVDGKAILNIGEKQLILFY